MIHITYIDAQGQSQTIEAEEGMTLMEAALRNGISGIEAECGGACSCATCHVYIEDEWAGRMPAAEPMEEDMLDFAFDVRPTSRLSCQIRLQPKLNGLVVHIPERQG